MIRHKVLCLLTKHPQLTGLHFFDMRLLPSVFVYQRLALHDSLVHSNVPPHGKFQQSVLEGDKEKF